MSRCDRCNVGVEEGIANCPLCGRHLNAEYSPPAFPVADENRLRRASAFNTFVKAVDTLALIAFIVNLFTVWGNFQIRTWWSFYVLAGTIFLHVAVFRPINARQFYWRESFWSMLFVLLYLLFIDWYADPALQITWSVTYVFPIVLAAISVAIATAVTFSQDPGNLLVVLIVMLLFSSVMLLLGALVFVNSIEEFTMTPTFVCFLVSLGLVLFFGMFKFRILMKALFKRFHI